MLFCNGRWSSHCAPTLFFYKLQYKKHFLQQYIVSPRQLTTWFPVLLSPAPPGFLTCFHQHHLVSCPAFTSTTWFPGLLSQAPPGFLAWVQHHQSKSFCTCHHLNLFEGPDLSPTQQPVTTVKLNVQSCLLPSKEKQLSSRAIHW